MDTIPLKPERQAELEKFAREHGQTPAAALDDAVESIRRGCEDVTAGRTVSVEEFDHYMRRKYDIPR